ncbi:MAG: SDR family NAD(P)-dependent oxidoreductase [Pirellulaceae bacterium]
MFTKTSLDAWETFFQKMCHVTEANWRAQQNLLRKYVGGEAWAETSLAKQWSEPVQQMQRQWSTAVADLMRTQQDVVHAQFQAVQNAMGSMFGSPATGGAKLAEGKATAEATIPRKAVAPEPKPAPAASPVRAPAPPAAVGAESKPVLMPLMGNNMNIAQKVAVVTGGASGIGEAVGRQLALRGAKAVLLVDRSDRVHEIARAIDAEVGRSVAEGLIGDTTDASFRARVFDNAMAQHGIVSICVPAAGITRDSLAVRLDKATGKAVIYAQEKFQQVTEVNLLAPIYWALEMVARIAEDRHQRGMGRWEPVEEIQGTVVFLGSVSSQGNKGQISYAVAKAGLEGAAATLTKEAIFYGVRCAIIHPGFTDTPMVRALGEEYVAKNVLPYTQLRRLIRPEEIADAICFMICNSAVSGELWADAGWHPPA